MPVKKLSWRPFVLAAFVLADWNQEILVISPTDFFDAASRRHNDVILLPAIRRVSGNDFVFQQNNSAPAHRAAHVQQLNCCIKKRHTFLCQTCGLQAAQISVLWFTRSGLSCSIVSTKDKSLVRMNWNGGSSMSGAVLNSRFLTRPVVRKTSNVCPC